MILCDANVLVYAHKEGVDRHDEYRAWLEDAINGDETFGVSDLVLSSVLRIVTHPRVFDPPSTWDRAREFAHSVWSAPNAVPVARDRATGRSSPSSGARQAFAATSCRTLTWLPWRSSPDQSGSQRIVPSHAIRGCASGTRSNRGVKPEYSYSDQVE